VKSYRWLIFIIITCGLISFSCEHKIEISDDQKTSLASGPNNQAVNKDAYSKIYYVADDLGSDKSGDGSQQKPWASINHALSKITDASEDNVHALFVTEGDYSKATMQMKEFVDIYGGFSEKDWSRDISKFLSSLNGDNKRLVVEGADNARLDGFLIREGVVRDRGAGLRCVGVSPHISNNIFFLNKTLKPIPWNPKFIHEMANDGGAIYCANGASPLIEHNIFVENKTENGRGAGIALNNQCNTRIIGNVFYNNIAGLDDPMRSSDGGAISAFDWCNVHIENNIILENRADSNNDGGGIFLALWTSATVKNNIVVANWSGDDAAGLFVGGQEHRYDSPLDPLPSNDKFYVSISNNVFIGNDHPSKNSGAMRFTMESRGEFNNNIVANTNGIYFQRSEVDISNNVILDNFLFIETKVGLLPGKISNNILWGDVRILTDVPVTNCNIRDGYPGEDNVSEIPQFINDRLILHGDAVSYGRKIYYTTVYMFSAGLTAGALKGRVVRAGQKWGVVRSNDKNTLTVWGDLSGEIQFTVLPTYRQAKM